MTNTNEPGICDAASVIALRVRDGRPSVLVGQRGSRAAFMPDKFVFPGGAVDPDDAVLREHVVLEPRTASLLARLAPEDLAKDLALAAIRELWEETGLRLAAPSRERPGLVPRGWAGFVEGGRRPRTEALRLVFRAITPPGRPRRFDARFFLVDAAEIEGAPDDFGGASGELRHLQWVELPEAGRLPLPFITEVVLSEVAALLDADRRQDRPVPFFNHSEDSSHFHLLDA